MAHGIPDPTVFDGQGRLTDEGMLHAIEAKATAIKVEAKMKISDAEQGEKMQNTTSAMDKTYAGLLQDVGLAASGAESLKLINDGLDFLEDRNSGDIAEAVKSPITSGDVGTFETLFKGAMGATPLERIELAGFSLGSNSTQKAGGFGEGINLSKMDTPDQKFDGVQQVRTIEYSRQHASELTQQMVAGVRQQQAPIRGQMMRGGPGMGMGGSGTGQFEQTWRANPNAPELELGRYAPKPPKFKEAEESEHSWAGIEST